MNIFKFIYKIITGYKPFQWSEVCEDGWCWAYFGLKKDNHFYLYFEINPHSIHRPLPFFSFLYKTFPAQIEKEIVLYDIHSEKLTYETFKKTNYVSLKDVSPVLYKPTINNIRDLKKELEEIGKNRKWLWDFISFDHPNLDENGEYKRFVTKPQVEIIKNLLNLFSSMLWTINFELKEKLVYKPDDKALRGDIFPVKITLCDDKYENKTFFGIHLGDLSHGISHRFLDKKEGIIEASHSSFNPAIFVPEINKIVFGYESWWGRIEDPKDLEKLITKETIENVWYVKLLKLYQGQESDNDPWTPEVEKAFTKQEEQNRDPDI